MDVLLLAFRLILAAVLGVAGASKLADPAGSRKALADFGVPVSVTSSLSIFLPLIEIASATVLLFTSLSWYGAVAGTILFAAFSAGMIVQMAKGKSPNCHCFGQLHSEPVSYKSLVRNAVFLVPAVTLVTAGSGRQGLGLADVNMAVAQLFAVFLCVLLLAAAVFFLRKISDQQTQIIRRVELLELISKDGEQVERREAGHPQDGLPIGANVPNFNLPDIQGGSFTNSDLQTLRRPSIFFFVSATCTPCKVLAPRFDEWEAELGSRVNLIFVSSGTPDENVGKFGSGAEKIVLLQSEREFADLFQARWTPTAVFVNVAGRVASHPATGDAAIIDLMDRIRASELADDYVHFASTLPGRPQTAASVGKELPEFSTAAVGGEIVSSTGLRGKPTLLAFWSPDCPHCVQMIDKIKEWDRAKGASDPQLVLFSSADPDKLRVLGLVSSVVSDKDFDLSGKLGMYGTPSAVLIDRKGRFASEAAVGAANIWSLVGRN
jgi:thiol-disulfide isomerase/thioredoxin